MKRVVLGRRLLAWSRVPPRRRLWQPLGSPSSPYSSGTLAGSALGGHPSGFPLVATATAEPTVFEEVLNRVEHGLIAVHDISGLPWWATLIGSTVAFRSIFLPLVYVQMKASGRVAGAMPDFQRLTKVYQDSIKANVSTKGWTRHTKADILKVYVSGLRGIKRMHDVSLTKLFVVPLAQIPVFVTFMFTMRRMINKADQVTSDLAHGGMWWFDNLTAPDPILVLPAFAIGLTALNLERGLGNPQNRVFFGLKNFLQGGLICTLPFTTLLPSGVFLYWGTSACFSALQSSVTRSDAVRALVTGGQSKP